MSVSAVIAGLNTRLGTIAGLTVLANPPESINEFPSSIAYHLRTETWNSASGGYSLHTIRVEVYEARQVLPQAVDRAKAWPDSVRTAVKADETLAGQATAILWPMRCESTPLRYGGQDNVYFGVRFEITYKVNEQ